MTGRLPNFIYIGPGKAGSTWLHETLICHPQVYLTEAKDLYFFDRYYERGPDWYRGQFRQADRQHRVVGEICQQYLFSEKAPQRMYATVPEAKLMITLREPAERAFSSYLYLAKHGAASGSFRDVLVSRPAILNPSRYASHLRRYFEYFDKRQLYCGVFDDLAEDPQRFIDPLLAWLGVDGMTLGEVQRVAKLPASRARSSGVAHQVRSAAGLARRMRAARLIGYIKRSRLVHKALYRPLEDDKPRLNPEDAHFVRDTLESEIADTEDLLGLNLRERWGWT